MREGISPFHPNPPPIFAAAWSCLLSAWTRGSATISFNCAVRDQLHQLAVSLPLKLKLHFLLRTAAGCCHKLISSLKLYCSCSLPYIAFKPLASLQLFAANTSFFTFQALLQLLLADICCNLHIDATSCWRSFLTEVHCSLQLWCCRYDPYSIALC
jgi:hypothetical protein